MRKQRVLDWVRRGLIALLLVTALVLLRNTGYYTGFRELLLGRVEAGERVTTVSDDAPRAAVTVPLLSVAVCGPEGGARYGAAYDEQTGAVLRRFSVDLGEALGSAGDPAAMSEAEYHELLSGCGVSFRFGCPLRLNLLSGWLGTEMSGAAGAYYAETVCLSATETEITLAYRTQEGGCYRCATAVRPEGLRARTTEYSPNNAFYAWETDRVPDGDALLLPDAPQPAAVKSAVTIPQGEEMDAVLRSVGINSFVASSYTEADGTVVYVNDDNSLRISPAGTAFFRRAASADAQGGDDLAAAVDSAWRTAEQSIGGSCGDAELIFAGASSNEQQHTCTVLLDYAVDGIAVSLASGHAAEIVLRDDTVIQARLQFRCFTRSEERTVMLPYLQAAAIALSRDAVPMLVYADAGDETECMWVIADG